MRYTTYRSHADKQMHVIFVDGTFASLPDGIRKLGPWQVSKCGELERLLPLYRTQLAAQGFAVVYRNMVGFDVEARPAEK